MKIVKPINNFDEFYVTDFNFVDLNLSKDTIKEIKKAQKFLNENKKFTNIFMSYYDFKMYNEDMGEANENVEACGFKIYDNEIYFICYVKGSNLMLESDPITNEYLNHK